MAEKKNLIIITRGSTPTLTGKIKSDEEIPMNNIIEAWVYITQNKKVKVYKNINDVSFDLDNNSIIVTLSQNDTLNLKANTVYDKDTFYQIRLLFSDTTAIVSNPVGVLVNEVYKEGVIKNE